MRRADHSPRRIDCIATGNPPVSSRGGIFLEDKVIRDRLCERSERYLAAEFWSSGSV